jgi:hypothetical protein
VQVLVALMLVAVQALVQQQQQQQQYQQQGYRLVRPGLPSMQCSRLLPLLLPHRHGRYCLTLLWRRK